MKKVPRLGSVGVQGIVAEQSLPPLPKELPVQGGKQQGDTRKVNSLNKTVGSSSGDVPGQHLLSDTNVRSEE